MDYKARVKNLAASLDSNGFAGAMLTDANDICYYTGHRPTAPAFLMVGKEPVLFVSSVENEALSLKGIEVKTISKLKEIKPSIPAGVVGFDENSMTARQFLRMRKFARLKSAAGLVKAVRAVKEKGEIELMQAAIRRTAKIMQSLEIKGRTEESVLQEIRLKLLKNNATEAYEPIISASANSHLIHHKAGIAKIGKGMIILDMGARYKGYCSDITRTALFSPTREQGKIFENVSDLQISIIESIRPGSSFKSVNDFYSKLMQEKKYAVMHSIGHSIGLEVHEPIDKLLPGTIMTVEPGVYKKGIGGCRVEDMVLIKKNGAKVLSDSIPKTLG